MKKRRISAICLTLALVFLCTGCAGKNLMQDETTAPMEKQAQTQRSENADAAKSGANEPAPAEPSVVEGAYFFTWLSQDADGTTTDVIENAYELTYNKQWFTPIKEESDAYMATFYAHGPAAVENVTVRIVRSSTDEGFPADCRDYFNLEELDNAASDDIKQLETSAGRVTYYISASNPDSDGYVCDVYYAIDTGDVAFCGQMDMITDSEGAALDVMMAKSYIEDMFKRGEAQELFENLFIRVSQTANMD